MSDISNRSWQIMDFADLPPDEFARLWAIQSERTSAIVDCHVIPDQSVVAGKRLSLAIPLCSFELRIGRVVLWQELTQARVCVENDGLCQFVESDLANSPDLSRAAYLEIAQGGQNRTEQPQWIWFATESVVSADQYVAIRGTCHSIQP